MRSIHRLHLPPRRGFAALAALLALAACDREILRDEARPAGPSRVQAGSSEQAVGIMTTIDMNESGEVVGMTSRSGYHWRPGGIRREISNPAYGDNGVSDINNPGTVVGWEVRGGITRMILWTEAGGLVTIPLPAGWLRAYGGAINDAGVVAGRAVLSDGSWRSFRWTAQAGMQLLPRADPGPVNASYLEYPLDINEAGDILGYFSQSCAGAPVTCPDGRWHGAVVWTASGGQRVLEGSRSGRVLGARDLTGNGVVAGCYDGGPALWNAAGARQPLGEPGQAGCAAAANDAGVVVGTVDRIAFRWTAAGGMQSLGTLGGNWSEANDVNEAGDITGRATTDPLQGEFPPFLWTPEGRMQRLDLLPNTELGSGVVVNEARQVAGQSGDWTAFWYDIVVNRPPVAHAGGPYTGRISGRRYTYSAAATQDLDGTRLRYSWDMDDNSRFDAVTNAALLGYTYPAGGSYTIRLVVLDDGGSADTTVTTAQVAQNVAPVIASLTGMPTSRGEGLPITLTPTVRDANQSVDSTELSLVRYRWDWGDGHTSATRTGTHAYADQGTYTVRLVVTDAGGMADTVVRTAVIGNVAPRVTAQATSPTTFSAGGSLSVSATFTDVPADAPWRYRIYWGDGAYTLLTAVAAGATITGSHAYARPGSYQPYVAVVDKDGGSGHSAAIAVTVTP